MTQTKAELLQTRHQGDIRLGDADSTHYVGFKAPSTVGTSLVWTLPAADGTANYLLKTDGSGNLGWVADSTTDSTKMPLTGGTFTGDVTFDGATAGRDIVFDRSDNALEFADNANAKFGNSADLQIFHDGTDNIIKASGSATPIKIQGHSSNASSVHISARADKETIKCLNNTNAPYVELYYDNGKKFETMSYGAKVTGNFVTAGHTKPHANNTYDLGDDASRWKDIYVGNDIDISDNGKILLGTGDDLQLYHDAGNSWLKEAGTGALYIDTDGSVIAMTKGGASENMAKFFTDGAVELYHNNVKKFETTTSGATVTGNLITTANLEPANNIHLLDNKKLIAGASNDLQIFHDGTNNNIDTITGELRFNSVGATKLYYNSNIIWYTQSDGTTHRLRFHDNTSIDFGNASDIRIFHDGSNSEINNATGNLHIRCAGGAYIQNAAGTENRLKTYENGSVELYHDNVKKIETTSAGVTVTGTVSDSIGELRQIPSRSVSSTTLTTSDVGKAILATSTVTVPNSTFSAGDAVTIINNSGGDITISKSISTMYLASDGTSANRTLATRGMATIWFASGTVAYISGAGLS